MAPSNKSKSATAAAAAAAPTTTASATPLIVKLKLPSKLLAKFSPSVKAESDTTTAVNSKTASPPSEPTPAHLPNPSAEATPAVSAPPSEAPGTPAPQTGSNNDLLAPSSGGAQRKGVPGPKPGLKRSASQLDINKAKGKPGPKKKARVEGDETPGTAAPAAPGPKLGPKANLGAINERLRALDRTKTPCRKWARKGFTIKSFTGVSWDVKSTWAAPKKPDPAEFAGDVKSDESLGEGVVSNQPGSSNVGSGDAGSNAEGVTPLPVNGESTPVVAAAA